MHSSRAAAALVGSLLLAACSSAPAPATDVSVDDHARCADRDATLAPDSPDPVAPLAPLADLRFDTAAQPLALHQWYAPCASVPRLLVIRTLAAWSGRAQHAAEHTRRLLAHPPPARTPAACSRTRSATASPCSTDAGKALAAYERTLRYPATAFDRYVAGEVGALTESQRDGLRSFVFQGCVQCHHGPALSDDSFHAVGMPTGRRDAQPDRGRIDALAALRTTPFRSDGPYSDDRTPGPHLARLRDDPSQLGQFHTPSLRGVRHTGPWGHGGTFRSLANLVRHYAHGLQLAPVDGTTGTRDLHLPWFVDSDSTIDPIVELLEAL